ncbi:hypothetical protein VTO42DRAFT_6788 [Malbranchea cinnamomea]
MLNVISNFSGDSCGSFTAVPGWHDLVNALKSSFEYMAVGNSLFTIKLYLLSKDSQFVLRTDATGYAVSPPCNPLAPYLVLEDVQK